MSHFVVIRRLLLTLDVEIHEDDGIGAEAVGEKVVQAIEVAQSESMSDLSEVSMIEASWYEDERGAKTDGATKHERAMTALIELADALEALPAMLRPSTLFGPNYNPTRMRQDAAWIANVIDSAKEAMS